MPFENIDNSRDPHTDEFEKLEFLPEEPASEKSDSDDDTAEIVFDPDLERFPEPPVSFDLDSTPEPVAEPEVNFFGAPAGDLDLEAETPFELFGTSLFGERGLEADEFEDLDDDLEF